MKNHFIQSVLLSISILTGSISVSSENTFRNSEISNSDASLQTSSNDSATSAQSSNSELSKTGQPQRISNSAASVYTIIDVIGSRYGDRMWVFTEPTCTRGFDNGWDGYKMIGASNSPQLFAMETVGNFQIDAVPTINHTFLGFMAGEDTSYTLTFTHANLQTYYTVLYLIDLLSNTTKDITASGSQFSFTAQNTTSFAKRFEIVTALTPTSITSQSTASQTQWINGTFSAINISANGCGTLAYQWYRNTTASNIGGTAIAGATAASYTPLATIAGSRYYYCIVSGAYGTATSTVSGVFVTKPSVVIDTQNTPSQTNCINSSFAAMSVSASGIGTLTYQWYSNTSANNSSGISLGSANGAQTASYTPQATNAGIAYYYCIVSGANTSATSAVSGAITTNPATGETFFTNGSTSVCQNSLPETYTATAANSTSIIYAATPTEAGTINPNTGVMNWNSSYTGTATITATSTGTCGTTSANRTVIVSTLIHPLVSITASTNNVMAGTSITFTATPTAGGTSPTYQWYKGNTPVGTNSASYSFTPANGDVIKVVMTSNATCTNEATANSNSITAIINNGFPVTFTTPENGSLAVFKGITQISSGNLIPIGTTLQIVTTPNSNYALNTLTANGTSISSELTISEATNIAATFKQVSCTWTGATNTDWNVTSNWTPNTVPTAILAANIPNVANKPIISATAICKNLTIESGAVLTIPVEKSLTVLEAITNNAGTTGIVIKSDSTNASGSLIFHNDANTPVSATVEMYSKASWDLQATSGSRFNWQFFGVPVKSISYKPTFSSAIVRRHEESGNSSDTRWIQLSGNENLSPFTGYELVQKNPTTYTFKGQLENSDLSKSLAYTSSATYPGQYLIANPYTAAIDITKLSFGDQTEASVYLYNTGSLNNWNSNKASNIGANPGQYTVSTKNTAGIGQIPGQVPSMQAFVIKARTSGTNATLYVPYNAAITPNTGKQRAQATNSSPAYMMIDVTGSRFGDRMWIFSNSDCTKTFDNGWDGYKLIGSATAPQIFAAETDGNYQIDAVPDINNTKLGFMSGEDSIYTLQFTHENITSTYKSLYLIDLLLNKTVEITTSGTEYSFVAPTGSTTENRFKILANTVNTTNIQNPNTSTDLLDVFSCNKTVIIRNNSNMAGQLYIYDIAGRIIQTIAFSANTLTTIPTELKQGTYIAKVINKNNITTIRNILIR